MRTRCKNPNFRAYHYYGGRGIKVCEEWEAFENFRDWALQNGYKEELTLDRIDANGNYEPSNCRWATRKEQSRNTRGVKIIEYNGVKKSIAEWAEDLGINYHTLYSRLTTLGWSAERALCK